MPNLVALCQTVWASVESLINLGEAGPRYLKMGVCLTPRNTSLPQVLPLAYLRGGPCASPPPAPLWPDRRDVCNYFGIIFSAV